MSLNRFISFFFLFLLVSIHASYSQSIFTSNGDGDWTNPLTWDEDNQGNADDADGIPDSNDDVIINHLVSLTTATNQLCLDLTIDNGSLIFVNNPSGIIATGVFTANNTASITSSHTGGFFGVSSSGRFNVSSGASLTATRVDFSINNTANISGTITFAQPAVDRLIFRDINLSSTSTWTNNSSQSFFISGDFENNSVNTFTPCSTPDGCTYVLSNSNGTVSGTGSTVFSSIVVNGTITNQDNLTVQDDIIGVGTFVNDGDLILNSNGGNVYSISNLDFNNVGSTVTYNGSGNLDLANTTYRALTINMDNSTDVCQVNGGDISVDTDLVIDQGLVRIASANTLTINNNFNLNNGEFESNDVGATLNVGGDLNMVGGVFDQNDGDINITGDLLLTGGTLTMNESTSTSTLDVDNFTFTSGSATLSEGELNVTSLFGGLTVNSGVFTLDGAAIAVSNDININGGTNDYNGGSLSGVDFNLASGRTVNLGDATFSVSGNTTLDGSLILDGTGGTKSFSNITVNGTGSWNVTAAESFNISGNITNNGTWVGCPNNSCDYTLTSNSGSFSGSNTISFSDLIIDNPAIYSSSATITVSDRFTGSGTFTNTAGNSLSLGGGTNDVTNFTTSGVGTTVTYDRSGGSQGLNPTTDGQYYNLVISTDAAANDVTMSSSETITNQLTLTTGDLLLGVNTLTMEDGATIVGGNSGSYISINGTGLLRQNYSAAGATLQFPIGDNDDFSPINSLTITEGTFGADPNITFDIDDVVNSDRDIDNTPNGDDDGTPAIAYLSRFWTLSASDITSPRYNATYTYLEDDIVLNGGGESDLVGAVYRTPPGQAFLDWHVSGSINHVTNLVSINKIDAFGVLYAMDNTDTRLPIVLINFDANLSGSAVFIEWSTATEINNNFFTIQRSRDASNWQDIITVDGAGNSDGVLNYNVNDNFPLGGRSFYRLKQTDFDGSFTYSEVSSVYFDPQPVIDLKVYPNPINRGQLLRAVLPDPDRRIFDYRLLNARGEIVKTGKISSKQLQLETDNLKKGIYLLNVFNSTVYYSKKILID